jgi:hypothetical protein
VGRGLTLVLPLPPGRALTARLFLLHRFLAADPCRCNAGHFSAHSSRASASADMPVLDSGAEITLTVNQALFNKNQQLRVPDTLRSGGLGRSQRARP